MMTNKEMLTTRNKTFGPPEVIYIEKKEIPALKDNQILIKVMSATVSTADVRLRSRNVPRGFGFIMGLLFGFSRPKYEALGTDLSGEIIEVGKKVKNFKVGDRVVANLGMSLGAHAQYKILNDSAVVVKIPSSISYEHATALVFGGTTALVFLRDKLKLKPGERLLIIGSGGAVGSAAIQLGALMGAHVTGICSSEKSDITTKLGANKVIDYKKTDWLNEKDHYDVILDTVGNIPYQNLKSKLKNNGRLGLIVADLLTNLSCAFNSLFDEKKVYAGAISEKISDLEYLVELCAKEKFKPLIGEILPFDKIVQAHKIVENGHKTGNLIIRF